MAVTLNPYLGFRDNARAALEFYHHIFGGQLQIMTFADMHASQDPAEADKVMHGQITGDHGVVLMVSDTPNSMPYSAEGTNFSVSLSGDDVEVLRGYWAGLIEGGTILEPLVQAPWGAEFGMVRDAFGVTWLLNIGS